MPLHVECTAGPETSATCLVQVGIEHAHGRHHRSPWLPDAPPHTTSPPKRASLQDVSAAHAPARFAARRSRVLTVLTALAFVVSGLIGLHHEATTSHATCEHGELVHGTVASSGLAAAANPDTVVRG